MRQLMYFLKKMNQNYHKIDLVFHDVGIMTVTSNAVLITSFLIELLVFYVEAVIALSLI